MAPMELKRSIVYGPVHSRRLGRSLGINLLPVSFKLCSLNCCYCQYGWTRCLTTSGKAYEEFFPSVPEVILALRCALTSGEKFDHITFSGNGEPTLHPRFPTLVSIAREMTDFYRCPARLAVLSNSTTCGDPKIREALRQVDLPVMKLDVGNERAFRRINRGAQAITLQSVVNGLKSLPNFVVQSMFVRGVVDNSTDEEVESWIAQLRMLNLAAVQIYSIDRGTASSKIEKVDRNRLNEIAAMTREATGLTVDVY